MMCRLIDRGRNQRTKYLVKGCRLLYVDFCLALMSGERKGVFALEFAVIEMTWKFAYRKCYLFNREFLLSVMAILPHVS